MVEFGRTLMMRKRESWFLAGVEETTSPSRTPAKRDVQALNVCESGHGRLHEVLVRMRAQYCGWKVVRENEQCRRKSVHCPYSCFVFPEKCASMQHRPVYQV